MWDIKDPGTGYEESLRVVRAKIVKALTLH